MLTEGNQQERKYMLTETERAWLAGFWDGEGTITIFTHKERDGQEKICPTLVVVNTNEQVIAHVVDLLDRLGTSFQIAEVKSKTDKHKDCYRVLTRNVQYIKVVVEAMLPYLVCKKAQAQLMLRYVNKKLNQRLENKRPRYDDDEDRELQKDCQLLNRRGKFPESSTTTREDD